MIQYMNVLKQYEALYQFRMATLRKRRLIISALNKNGYLTEVATKLIVGRRNQAKF